MGLHHSYAGNYRDGHFFRWGLMRAEVIMPWLSFIKKNKVPVVMLNHYSIVVLPSQHFSAHRDPCWIHHLPLYPFPESSSGSANEKELSE